MLLLELLLFTDVFNQERIRGEFKRKILSNVTPEQKSENIKQEFRKQILTNLRNETPDDVTADKPAISSSASAAKVKREFQQQILDNLKR